MSTTIQFLDAVKASAGVASDYALAPILGVTRSQVSKWRVGKDFIGDSTAIRVADLLKIDRAYVIACAHAERAKHDDEKAVWQSIIGRFSDAKSLFALSFCNASPAVQACTPATIPNANDVGKSLLC